MSQIYHFFLIFVTIMRGIPFHILILLIVASLIGSCTRTPARYVAALAAADSLADNRAADSARTLLACIPADSLSRADKALFYLLAVKTTDKAYLKHTSTDTIRLALDYFRSHGPKLRRAEARYYEARVLSDLKDYAAALDAYDEALAILADDTSDTTPRSIRLRSLINSQTAQVLTSLRLYAEAIPFYENAVKSSLQVGDSTNCLLNVTSLVFCLKQVDLLDSANSLLVDAMMLFSTLSTEDRAELDISRRDILRARHQYGEAVNGIDTVLSCIHPMFRNTGLMIAAVSYQKLGILDSAVHYANLLSNQPDPSNKSIAYNILLQNSLNHNQSKDALPLFHRFDNLTDSQIENASRAPESFAGAFLKYRIAQQKNVELLVIQHSNERRIVVLIIILLITVIIILWLRYAKIKTEVKIVEQEKELHNLTIENIELREQIPTVINLTSQREQIIQDILKNYHLKQKNSTIIIPPYVTDSSIVNKIRSHLATHTIIPEKSPLWDELITLFNTHDRMFLSTISALYDDRNIDFTHIIMLVRCGFSTAEIGSLLSKARSTISSHRSKICETIFMGKIQTKELDDVIVSI